MLEPGILEPAARPRAICPRRLHANDNSVTRTDPVPPVPPARPVTGTEALALGRAIGQPDDLACGGRRESPVLRIADWRNRQVTAVPELELEWLHGPAQRVARHLRGGLVVGTGRGVPGAR